MPSCLPTRLPPMLQVARKYLTDEHPDSELSFLPVNRSNAAGLVDPNLFAFLCFRTHLAKVCVQGKGSLGTASLGGCR